MSKEGLITNLEKKVKKTAASLALVTALNLTPIATEQKSDPNIGLPNASTISLSLENKAYAAPSETENNKELYTKLSNKFPKMFNKHLNPDYIIKKDGDRVIAVQGMTVIAEYQNGDWQNLPEHTVFRQENQIKTMVENLESLTLQTFEFTKEINPFGISKEDIEEYNTTGKTDQKSFLIINNQNGDPRLVIAKKGYSEKSIEAFKKSFDFMNKVDSKKLDDIAMNSVLRIIAGDIKSLEMTGTTFVWSDSRLLQYNAETTNKEAVSVKDYELRMFINIVSSSQLLKQISDPNYFGQKVDTRQSRYIFFRGYINSLDLSPADFKKLNDILDRWEKR